ncbi:hypothetical protein NDU88_007141 [Pleurodeles waltl]|uniref:Uncharacterized protein n=1 Tax=Pleurodeles waltl TaxID=8319 RepID=A0AAV7NWJ0_PLEWA|nr:hypothetical protein NDU88_007141 [Pleurodeles waltl]
MRLREEGVRSCLRPGLIRAGRTPVAQQRDQERRAKTTPQRSFSRCVRHGSHLVKAARISGKNRTSRGGTPVGKGLTKGRKERQLVVERKQRQGGIEISSPKEQPSSMAARRRCRAVLKPSPDRRLTETRGGSSTPPGLGPATALVPCWNQGPTAPSKGEKSRAALAATPGL